MTQVSCVPANPGMFYVRDAHRITVEYCDTA